MPAFLNISTSELLIVLLVVLLLFGPQKLPEIVRFMGKMINQIKQASEEVKREITQASSGLDKEVRDAAGTLRREADEVKKHVMDAVPRQSFRTFEKATTSDYPKASPGESDQSGMKDENENSDKGGG